jgi:hypothetical protein
MPHLLPLIPKIDPHSDRPELFKWREIALRLFATLSSLRKDAEI